MNEQEMRETIAALRFCPNELCSKLCPRFWRFGDKSKCAKTLMRDSAFLLEILLLARQERKKTEPLTDREQDRKGFFALVDAERSRQDEKWGYPQRNTFCEWGCILGEEFGEAAKELNELNFGRGSKERLVDELIHTAAVCLSIIEHYDVANAYATEPKGEPHD